MRSPMATASWPCAGAGGGMQFRADHQALPGHDVVTTHLTPMRHRNQPGDRSSGGPLPPDGGRALSRWPKR